MKLSKILVTILMLLILVPSVSAVDFYPSSTPYICSGSSVDCTIDITPRYYMIKKEPIEVEIQLKYEVTEETRDSPIAFYIQLYEPWTDLLEGLEILDKDDNVVGYLVKDKYDGYGEGSPYGWEYFGVVNPDGCFSKGDYFIINFKTEWDGTVDSSLGILLFETWSWSVDGERYFAIYRLGDEYIYIEPPRFTVPELPMGALTALIIMVSVVLIRKKHLLI